MTNSLANSLSQQSMTLLSRLVLTPLSGDEASSERSSTLKADLRNINREAFDELVRLASSNHVIVRGMEVFLEVVREAKDETRFLWAQAALATERARIDTALRFLREVCRALECERHYVVVIKSLDHWPDFGSDLDLFTNADSDMVSRFMMRRFNAKTATRSWGDRLAGKWNFLIPGLPEAVEIHVQRLGQTGEQVTIASSLIERSRNFTIDTQTFQVPSASDRLMISTLQRMYRHFYFRLCDIVDSAALLDAGGVDYRDLRTSATNAGIWEGVATYLVIVSDYVRKYRGVGLDLPHFVRASARFGGNEMFYAKEFLRIPIMPQSATLYGTQLAGLLRRLELKSGARLSLLPWLATAALVGQRITGSDKGIW
jgi:hypothetical protein